MNLTEVQEKLTSSIARGLVNKFNSLDALIVNEGLYAFVLFAASGFKALGIAVSTQESLARIADSLKKADNDLMKALESHPELLRQYEPSSKLYAEMTASEWEYLFSDIPEFEELDALVERVQEKSFTDEEFEASEFLARCVVEGLQKFKNAVDFNASLLLGLQFGDGSESESEIVRQISAAVNDEAWHQKWLELNS